MLRAVEEALARLYPGRRWGQPDDLVRFEAGVSPALADRLCEELASELRASVYLQEGGPEEYCDYLYVLCMGREPSLVQVREGTPAPPELLDGGPIRELYLRVCLSTMAPMAAVQQTALELEDGGEMWLVRELPRAGVFDAPLLPRMQRLVAVLQRQGILHLDFGEISAPPPGYHPGEYGARYGGQPDVANYLFYPQPTTMQRTSCVPRQLDATPVRSHQ